MLDVIDDTDTDPIIWRKCWGYDLETYPNWFSAVFVNLWSGERLIFEISPRQDDADALWQFLWLCQQEGRFLIGFNNNGFDYPVLHHFMMLCYSGVRPTAADTYTKAQAIIDAPRGDWTHNIWESDQFIPQIDVFKLMHFDNRAKSVSLKALEVAMRSAHVEDLPHPPGVAVPPEMYDPMIWYNCYDVDRTVAFAKIIWEQIEFRWDLDRRLGGRSRVNQNDVKIGTAFIEQKLKEVGVETRRGGKPIQTLHPHGIPLKDIMLPVEFDNAGLQAIYNHFWTSTIQPEQTKGFFTGLHATVGGVDMHFGTGGLHGALPSRTFYADQQRMVQLADVSGYYPSLLVANGWYPAHLGPQFVDIFRWLIEERKKYAKTDMEAKLYKLSANGSFGNFGSRFSYLKDDAVLLSITINGQLLLARLAEVLDRIPSLQIIQVNTDGICYICDRADEQYVKEICDWWMQWTRLSLDYENYQAFYQRDVNNYVGIGTDGKPKQKGAYVTNRQWHQDRSSLVIQKAVMAYIQDGTPLDRFIYNHTDAFDFMIAVKVPRSSRLMWGETKVSNICRYHIALDGAPLTKVMPPLKDQTEERHIGINQGWNVNICNVANDFNWQRLNRRWYLNEAEALLSGLGL